MNDENLKLWLNNSKKISKEEKLKPDIVTIFNALLNWIHKTEYSGACHDTSAVMHILLSEAKIESSLCIGIAKTTNNNFFDHSWIEIDGHIYDASISLQNQISFPPVFFSLNLENNSPPSITYGVNTEIAFDAITTKIIPLNLREYSQLIEKTNRHHTLWDLVKIIGKEAGMEINIHIIEKKHSNKKRKVIKRY